MLGRMTKIILVFFLLTREVSILAAIFVCADSMWLKGKPISCFLIYSKNFQKRVGVDGAGAVNTENTLKYFNIADVVVHKYFSIALVVVIKYSILLLS